MNEAGSALIELLDLEPIEVNLFRGQSRDIGRPSVYGGQVVAQGLVAATRTVEAGLIHSLHAYFLRPGDMGHPIVYEVDRVRNGRSFTTRRVQAIQHGEVILSMIVSFQREENGLEHQMPMPDVQPPEALATGFEMRAKVMGSAEALKDLPPERRDESTQPLDLEFRVEPEGEQGMVQYLWFRSTKPVPDDPLLHQCMLAFASDFGLIGSALKPHGRSARQHADKLFIASLDHAVWFHRSFRVDEWLLYYMDSPSAQGARGFARGLIFDRAGRLVASTAQEGVMRLSE